MLPDALSDSVYNLSVIKQVYFYSALQIYSVSAYMWWTAKVIFSSVSTTVNRDHSTSELLGQVFHCADEAMFHSPLRSYFKWKLECCSALDATQINIWDEKENLPGSRSDHKKKRARPGGILFKQNKAKSITISSYGEAIWLIFKDRGDVGISEGKFRINCCCLTNTNNSASVPSYRCRNVAMLVFLQAYSPLSLHY